MKIVDYIMNPPILIVSCLVLVIIFVLRRYLQQDHFYTLMVSTFLSFLFAEITCRYLNIGNPEIAKWVEERVQKGNSFTYKPNSKLIYYYPDNPRGYFDNDNKVTGKVNENGFRGISKPLKKPKGIYRIAFVGDSFTLGIGVKDEDTLPAKFEEILKSKYSFTEVLNFGISGTSTKQQISLLESDIIPSEPDTVIIVLFLNDANRVGTIRFLSRPRLLANVRKYSYFINASIGSFEKLVLHEDMIEHYHEGFKEGSKGWDKIKAGLKRGKLLSEKHNFKFIVAVYPVLIQLNENYPFKSIHTKIKNYCESLNIPFVDLLNSFIGKKDSELWVHRTDQHPNEIAQKIAGAELADYIDKQAFIKK